MRRILLTALALLLLPLWGCGEENSVETRIPITLVAGEGYTVENNGQWVEPGEDA